MEPNENNSDLKIGARVEAVRERIKFLENRIGGYRKHARVSRRDEAELEKLRTFLQSLGLSIAVIFAALVVVVPLPLQAQDAEGYARSDEDTALALLCDAEIDPDLPGIIRDRQIRECISAYRDEANSLESEP
jgi:hypothetical protein